MLFYLRQYCFLDSLNSDFDNKKWENMFNVVSIAFKLNSDFDNKNWEKMFNVVNCTYGRWQL